MKDNFKCDVGAKWVDHRHFPMDMAETIDGEPEVVHSDAVVDFSVTLDTTEWGVEAILINVSMIEIAIGDHELCIKQFEPATINGVNDDQWEIEEFLDLYTPDKTSIYPVEIELDWNEKKVYISF